MLAARFGPSQTTGLLPFPCEGSQEKVRRGCLNSIVSQEKVHRGCLNSIILAFVTNAFLSRTGRIYVKAYKMDRGTLNTCFDARLRRKLLT